MAEPVKNDAPDRKDEQQVIKDKPRPVSIYLDESAKTSAALKQVTDERRAIDDKYNTTGQTHAQAIEALKKRLKEAADQRLSVRQETVEKLSGEVGTTRKAIEELQKRLLEESNKLSRSQDALGSAQSELKNEGSRIAKEDKIARKAKFKEQAAEFSVVHKERKQVYAKTRKQLRRERWNTFKRTTKESIAFVPDLVFRFGKAAHHAAGEIAHVFCRSAKKAQEGFNKPTPFSITREQPLAPPKKPDAPKA